MERKLSYQLMRELSELLKKYELKPYRYQKLGHANVVETNNGKYVIKEKTRSENNEIFKYLEARNFLYYPEIISKDTDDYTITRFEESVDMPDEQKMLDLIDLVTLLHNKTTHFKEVDEADYKKIFEDITNNIEYLRSYYLDIITVIESKVYMSPSEYLLARNISKIFSALNYCSHELNSWLDLVKNKRKQRFVVLHNHLELDHFIRNKNAYLISWEKSKIDLPIFDLYKLYKKHGLDFDFESVLRHYEKGYPLLEEERKLFFILISLPNKIEFSDNEYELSKKISKEIDFLYKTESLLSPYYAKDKKYKANEK